MIKRLFVCICCFVFLLATCIVGNKQESYTRAMSSGMLNNEQIIIIDAGHGGFDGGASAADGTLEKNINLRIALKLKALLQVSGFNVIMTRSSDTGTESNQNDTIANRKVSDMHNRLNLMNEYPDAIFVSVHLNKFTTTDVNGAQVFYSPNNMSSVLLAQSVQAMIIEQLQPNNKRTVKRADKSIFLLDNAVIPAVIVECGFLSNTEELKLLKNEEYQAMMAFSIYCGILNYFSQM